MSKASDPSKFELPESRQTADLVRDFTGLTQMSARSAIDNMVNQMLHRLATTSDNAETRTRAGEAFIKINPNALGVPGAMRVNPLVLQGPPGHGKSSLARAAARIVASSMGLKFLMNPGENVVVDHRHFVFIDLNLPGQPSAELLGGMPAVMAMNEKTGALEHLSPGTRAGEGQSEVMGYLPDYRVLALNRAAAGVLNLDDVSRALPNVAQAALSLLLENQYDSMALPKSVYVTASMNMGGAMDKTSVTNQMNDNAWRGRVDRAYLVTGTEEWMNYMRARVWAWCRKGNPDGACGMAWLFGREPYSVLQDLDSGAQPRTIESATQGIANAVAAAGGLPAAFSNDNLRSMKSTVQSYAGVRAAMVFERFAKAFVDASSLSAADPIQQLGVAYRAVVDAPANPAEGLKRLLTQLTMIGAGKELAADAVQELTLRACAAGNIEYEVDISAVPGQAGSIPRPTAAAAASLIKDLPQPLVKQYADALSSTGWLTNEAPSAAPVTRRRAAKSA